MCQVFLLNRMTLRLKIKPFHKIIFLSLKAPQDCKGVLESGKNSSGLYVIDPCGGRQRLVTVYCDLDTDGGGWTVYYLYLHHLKQYELHLLEF